MNSLKRTQTNPILSAYMADKIALPALGCRYRGSEACGEHSRTVEEPVVSLSNPFYIVQKVAGLRPKSLL
jgi:hypothetical protein